MFHDNEPQREPASVGDEMPAFPSGWGALPKMAAAEPEIALEVGGSG